MPRDYVVKSQLPLAAQELLPRATTNVFFNSAAKFSMRQQFPMDRNTFKGNVSIGSRVVDTWGPVTEYTADLSAPGAFVLVIGEKGYASIYMNAEAPKAAPQDELLAAFLGLRRSEYGLRDMRECGVTAAMLTAMENGAIASGLLKRNKAGVCSLTPEGKAAMARGDSFMRDSERNLFRVAADTFKAEGRLISTLEALEAVAA